MGAEVIAKCKCGLVANSLIGGNMSDFRTTQYFPAMCETCSNVVEVNAKADAPQCPECDSYDVTLYNDKSLIDAESLKEAQIIYDANELEELGAYAELIDKDKVMYKTIASSFNLKLIDCRYKCPSCGDFSLRFYSTGLMFD